MHTLYYFSVLFFLSLFIVDSKSVKYLASFIVAFLLDMLLVDLLSLSSNDLLFFSTRALFDVFLIMLISKFDLSKIKLLVLYLCCILSYSINIYLCFEKGNVYVYRNWEDINLLLSEIMIGVLFIKGNVNMFNSFKLYFIGGLLALFAGLATYIKILTGQKENLKKELQVNKNNIIVLEKQSSDKKEILQEISTIQIEAQRIKDEDTKKMVKHERPTGSFLDPRL